jgi:cholesterol transport system auxiliary component
MANRSFMPDLKKLDRRFILLSASSFALAGCSGLGLGPTDVNDTIYMLQPALAAAPGGQPATWALAVDIPDALDSIDSRRIALVRTDSTLDYYANSVWPDRLPVLVQTALVAAFEASGRIPSVARTQDALHADYELGTELRDCTAHYSQPDAAPTVSVTIVAQMSTAHGRKIVSSFTAKQDAAASQNSTSAVVAAFNTAIGAAVAQMVGWAVALPPPPAL